MVTVASANHGMAKGSWIGEPAVTAVKFTSGLNALADCTTELDGATLLTLRAAWLKRAGKPFSHQASMAKLMASERAFAACNRVLALMGADGQDTDRPVERFFRDVRVTMIYEGTSEVQRLVVARDIARRFDDAREGKR